MAKENICNLQENTRPPKHIHAMNYPKTSQHLFILTNKDLATPDKSNTGCGARRAG